MVIDGESVCALEADGDAFAAFGRRSFAWLVLLEHVGCAVQFKPAPAELSVVDPFFGFGVAEAVDIEAERCLHVRDPEERDRLLNVEGALFGFALQSWHGISF
jgi:hypothetical protein